MLLSILYIVGITAEAMTGALNAGQKKMDWFGVMLVASVTAIGGGTARDILLGHFPVSWVAHPQYLAITCIAGIVTTVLAKWVIRMKGLFLRLDALGLVVFSIIGTNVAMTTGHPALICLVSAVVTGVFGGLLRDLICRRTPLILHKELYASVAFLSSGLYMGLLYLGVADMYATLITLVIGYSVRMSALRFHWRLPTFHLEVEESLH